MCENDQSTHVKYETRWFWLLFLCPTYVYVYICMSSNYQLRAYEMGILPGSERQTHILFVFTSSVRYIPHTCTYIYIAAVSPKLIYILPHNHPLWHGASSIHRYTYITSNLYVCKHRRNWWCVREAISDLCFDYRFSPFHLLSNNVDQFYR